MTFRRIDSQAKYLVSLLKAAGHDVLTIKEMGISGAPDDQVLESASQHNRVLLTRNCDDFYKLHQKNPAHSGIVAIYQNSENSKNMSYQAIVKGIENIQASGLNLASQFIPLNQWNY